MVFEFESDFAGSLRCIPMVVRQKLDIVGIKLSLRQWSRFSREERGLLAELPCVAGDAAPETAPATVGGFDRIDGALPVARPGRVQEQAGYRETVLRLIADRTDEAPVFLPVGQFDEWAAPDRMPEIVCSQAQADGVVSPSAEQWALLTPLQRFALIKLSRSKHENENFVPALKEFGIL